MSRLNVEIPTGTITQQMSRMHLSLVFSCGRVNTVVLVIFRWCLTSDACSFSFLPRYAMLARYVLWACVCLSVTSRSSTKTAKRTNTQTKPHDSPGTLVFRCQRSPRNSTGVNPRGHQMQVGLVKIGDFRLCLGTT